MAHSNQAKKRIRQNEKRHVRNKVLLTRMRTEIKRVLTAVAEGDRAAAEKALPEAMRRVDKAGKANVIHKNVAARRKGMMARALNRLGASS